MKKDFILPIIVLVVICAVISGALAATNAVTSPVIEAGKQERAETARAEVLPEADGFVKVELTEEIPGITECYEATNGAGYVISMSADGYGGKGSLSLMAAISPDGNIIAVKTLSNGDTKGIGSRVSEPAFEGQFAGMDVSMSGYQAITGATVSSKAYSGAVANALAAYEQLAGAQKGAA